MSEEAYERYPRSVVLSAVTVALAIYALGATILGRLGWPWAMAYLVYSLGVELSILHRSCRHCAYYGHVCGLGKGVICALLFGPGDKGLLATQIVSWRDIVPDMLVLILPFAGGVVALTREYDWLLLIMLVALVLLCLGGNAFVRGSLVCAHCAQRELGCPAQRLLAARGKG